MHKIAYNSFIFVFYYSETVFYRFYRSIITILYDIYTHIYITFLCNLYIICNRLFNSLFLYACISLLALRELPEGGNKCFLLFHVFDNSHTYIIAKIIAGNKSTHHPAFRNFLLILGPYLQLVVELCRIRSSGILRVA